MLTNIEVQAVAVKAERAGKATRYVLFRAAQQVGLAAKLVGAAVARFSVAVVTDDSERRVEG